MSKYRNEINSILSDIQKGDTSKQQILLDKTVNFLRIIALKYALDKNDYEDILIEAYLRIFKYINSFNIKKDGYNWMCRIVQNVAYDFNSQTVSNLPLTELTFSSIIGDEIDKFIAKDELFSIICNLSAQEQNLIYLRFYEGLTYLEIAKMLNSRKSTVHKQINTILKKLRK